MEFYEVERSDGAVAVRQTTPGRLAEAFVRFAVWGPLAMVGLSLLFMPDYVCQYREQQPVPGMFWGVIGAAALVIAGMAGFVRYARRDTWILDAREGQLVFRADPLIGPSAEATAQLSDVQAIVARQVSFPRVSGVAVELDGQPDEAICTSRFGWSTVSNVFGALETFVDAHDLDVDLQHDST